MLRVYKSNIHGSVPAPSSKSVAHRALICAALCKEKTTLQLTSMNEDIMATIDCLQNLCADIVVTGESVCITPTGFKPNAWLNCHESGSTLRFLLPVAWAMGGAMVTGEGRLPSRPLNVLLETLICHGAIVDVPHLPLRIQGSATAGTFYVPGNISSQYISGLLLCAPLLNDKVEIVVQGEIQSKPYVDMTIKVMQDFGVKVEKNGNSYSVPADAQYRTKHTYQVEGDWSGAANILALGALCGQVKVQGLDMLSTQGDKAILPLLEQMGAGVSVQLGEVCVTQAKSLKALHIDVANIPDLVPVLSALLMHAKGTSTLYNAKRLRYKESDRKQTVAEMIEALGGKVQLLEDAIVITGEAKMAGGVVQGAHDHRIVMAGMVGAMRCTGCTSITDAQAINKSYPKFISHFIALGGRADGIDIWQ